MSLTVESVSHRFGEVTALHDITLHAREGEFLTLLGPSGCGKTTLLRIISGFLRPTSGSVLFNGVDVTDVPPHKRTSNMVFQQATLFPHLDVFDNVAFGLRVARVSKAEISERVAAALALVRLEGYAARRSHELSGGQMQRVALARALVNRPDYLLLDEPLSALDQSVRLEMEAELRRVHRETGATFVYVTHDQREALALSDSIAVFRNGRIEQCGSPEEIYRRPASRFVARFVGNANVLPVSVIRFDGAGGAVVAVGDTEISVHGDIPQEAAEAAWLVVRPEVVELCSAGAGAQSGLPGVIRDVAFRGNTVTCRVELRSMAEAVQAELVLERQGPLVLGDEVAVTWPHDAAHLIPMDDDQARQGSAGTELQPASAHQQAKTRELA